MGVAMARIELTEDTGLLRRNTESVKLDIARSRSSIGLVGGHTELLRAFVDTGAVLGS